MCFLNKYWMHLIIIYYNNKLFNKMIIIAINYELNFILLSGYMGSDLPATHIAAKQVNHKS